MIICLKIAYADYLGTKTFIGKRSGGICQTATHIPDTDTRRQLRSRPGNRYEEKRSETHILCSRNQRFYVVNGLIRYRTSQN